MNISRAHARGQERSSTPFFNVLAEGSNLCIPGRNGEPPAIGFFTSRVVWANEVRNAEDKALQSVRDDWQTGRYASQPTSDQLKLTVSESSLSSFVRWVLAPGKGHVFFPADHKDDAPSVRPAD